MLRVTVCGAVNSGALRLVCSALSDAGFSACALSVQEEDHYRAASSTGPVSRLLLRLRIHVAFSLRLLWAALRAGRNTVFVVTTNPFCGILAVQCGSVFSGAKIVWLVHDLYPEALEAGGYLRPNGLGSRLCGWFTRLALRSADATVFVGHALEKHARQRWGAPRISAVIPPVSIYDLENSPVELPAEAGTLKIVYSGHLGHLHAAETLAKCVRAAKQMFTDAVVFHFQVSGPFVRYLKERLATEECLIEPTETRTDQHRRAVAASHLAMVSISPLGSLAAFPSKTFSALALGRPVLAMCPAWSDLGQLISGHQAGWVISNSDRLGDSVAGEVVADRFVESIRSILDGRRPLAEQARGAGAAFKELGSRERLVGAWKEVLEKVGGEVDVLPGS